MPPILKHWHTSNKLFVLNVRGMAASVKHTKHAMKEGGVKGSIICTTSLAASTGGLPSDTDYTMSKHAVLGMLRAASLRLAGFGFRVNSVSPGMVAMPMTCKYIGGDMELAKKFSRLDDAVTEKHVADAVSFSASDESEFVTGLDLVVDGALVVPHFFK